MTLSPTVLLITFGLVFPVELPDKTLIATVLLAARYQPLPVFVGVCCAFAVQCVIAVAFGGVLTLLPARAVAAVVAVLFGIGAVVLLREGFDRDDTDGGTAGSGTAGSGTGNGGTGNGTPAVGRSFLRVAVTAFGVLFVAEFGDASQLATAALTARYGAPLSVGLGAWLALTSVAAIAVLVGKRVGDRLPRRLFQRVAGAVFVAFALLATAEAVTG